MAAIRSSRAVETLPLHGQGGSAEDHILDRRSHLVTQEPSDLPFRQVGHTRQQPIVILGQEGRDVLGTAAVAAHESLGALEVEAEAPGQRGLEVLPTGRRVREPCGAADRQPRGVHLAPATEPCQRRPSLTCSAKARKVVHLPPTSDRIGNARPAVGSKATREWSRLTAPGVAALDFGRGRTPQKR